MSRTTLQNSMRIGLLKTVKMGGSVDALVSKGTVVSDLQQDAGNGNTGRSRGYDLNGDGNADVWRYDTFDASGKELSATVSLSIPGKDGTSIGFMVSDNNGDGKIDGLERGSTDGSSLWLSDSDHDGKTDGQSDYNYKNNQLVSNHNYSDMNRDGKIDYAWQSKRATSKDVIDALPTSIPNLGFGAISDVLAHATKLSATEDANTRTLQLDLNGDGQGDLVEYDALDQAGQITTRSFTASQTDANGQTTSLWFFDGNNDGKIDAISQGQGSDWTSFYDNNHDGKVDSETVSKSDGTWRTVQDTDGDGKADTVSSGGSVA